MTEMPHGRQIKGSLKNLLARSSPNKLDCITDITLSFKYPVVCARLHIAM